MHVESFALFIGASIVAYPIYEIFFSKQARETRELARETRLLESLNRAIEEGDIKTVREVRREAKKPFTKSFASLYLKAYAKNRQNGRKDKTVAKRAEHL